MFSYEHLASFCATLEEGSYSQAAKALNKDRTTIREQVKALEDSYAIQLFEIKGKKAVATESGLAIYRQAKLLVQGTEQLNTRLIDRYQTQLTHFDIYHDILVPNALILYAERYMEKHFAHIKLNWLHRNRDEVIDALTNNKNALAIMQNKQTHSAEGIFNFINLGTDEHSAYCHPNHPLLDLEDVTLGDLKITKQYISENHYYSMPELFSLSADQRLVSNNDVLLTLIQHDGWAIMSSSLAQPLVDSNQLVQLKIKEVANTLKIGISFYFPTSLNVSTELEGLSSALTEYAANHLN
ncbi:LysR family transcriptional regulator [Vibrio sp. 10N.286.49.B3]|uniref:LysR family transcriptional regulator n=1 Tax=Vibrio sp. 10N.286.49.B3 TaxID=1880855 RepID=UPI000C82F1D4|nr:LysR family transcriptional regulator [Vibrio sp. 10N.286.49.B3]PMH46161.1 LysR family transcriptional regulator [Vibrio sp. 10N.286.49.B3]